MTTDNISLIIAIIMSLALILAIANWVRWRNRALLAQDNLAMAKETNKALLAKIYDMTEGNS